LHSYKIKFSYIGTHFFGSQYQPGLRTVEGAISDSFARALKSEFSFVVSGRTDAGVHAEAQVGRLRILNNIPPERLLYCLRRCLPDDIVLYSVMYVDEDFHPRFSACYREYHYLYTPHRDALPFVYNAFVAQGVGGENHEPISPLLASLIGSHDFAAFRCLGSSEKSTRKTVFSCDMIRDSFVTPFSGSLDVVRFRIVADSFLYRMVRCILGALFEVMKDPDKAALFLDSLHYGKKVIDYELAPAKGLVLVGVGYRDPFVGNWKGDSGD